MFRRRNSSITNKLVWMNMVVSAAALILASAGFTAYALMEFRHSMVRHLSIQAQIAGSNGVSALLFNDPRSAANTLAALKAAPHVMEAEIYTRDGQRFAAYWRDRSGVAAPLPSLRNDQVEVHWFRSNDLVLVRRIIFQGKADGAVLIRSDLREINSRLTGYAIIIAVVFAACLAAVLLLSSVLQRAVAAPIVRLTEMARMVSRNKDYSIRIPQTGNRDEIDFLIGSFDEMLVQIQERDMALQRAHDDLERRVQERTSQLTVTNKELEAFSYSVSHDLRAPLRQINGFSGILSEEYGTSLDDAGRRYLGLIQDGARNMGRLVDALINLGRIGRQGLIREPSDINSLLQAALRVLQPEFEGRQIDWRIGALPTTECDPGLIKQVFANLLSNAVKYTRYQERAVIEIGQIVQDGEIVIFVRDNGAGFEPQYAHKLFGVFQRLHRAEEFEGTGVGLATVQRIIQNHAGRIWAVGEPGKGATFFFTLKSSKQSVMSPCDTRKA
ncbi:MAG: sensor histidine kinase [Terriglobia bacterium]